MFSTGKNSQKQMCVKVMQQLIFMRGYKGVILRGTAFIVFFLLHANEK